MNTAQQKIFLCRHGETEWTLAGKHTGRSDISLTKEGEKQARALRAALENIPFDAIYCSPLIRSQETCDLAGFSHQKILEPDAMEWNYGAYEGLTRQEIQKKTPNWSIFLNGAPQGESVSEVTQRADRLIEKLLHHEGNIALFSHGHFLRLLAVRWIGLEAKVARLFSLSVGSISILGFENSLRTIQLWNLSKFGQSSTLR